MHFGVLRDAKDSVPNTQTHTHTHIHTHTHTHTPDTHKRTQRKLMACPELLFDIKKRPFRRHVGLRQILKNFSALVDRLFKATI